MPALGAYARKVPFIRDRFLKSGCNAIDIRNFPILEEFSNINFDRAKKMRAVCYVGGIDEIRCLYEMIEAIGRTDIRLILAGDFGTEEQKKRAIEMKGWHNVEYVGYAGREEVRAVFSKAIAGLVVFSPMPNHVNALPNKMFEYMSAGLPVIASNFPLWKEIVEGNKCGLTVNPLSPKEIAEAIRYLLAHPEEARKMGENGRKAVLEKYNWDNESRKLMVFYNGG